MMILKSKHNASYFIFDFTAGVLNKLDHLFFNIPFDGKSNLEIAIVKGKTELLSTMFESASDNNVMLSLTKDEGTHEGNPSSLMKIAIENNDEQTIRHLLDTIQNRQTHFQDVVEHPRDSCSFLHVSRQTIWARSSRCFKHKVAMGK